MRNLFHVLSVTVAAVILASCGSIPYDQVRPGQVTGRPVLLWVGYDQFIYIPSPTLPFAFTTTATRIIQPGLMYTDGGSLPRVAQLFNGFSPWGYGPAYVIHDWIFASRACILAGKDGPQYNGIRDITFDESALILAEAIKTLVDYGQVRNNPFAANAISNAVDSSIARALWDRTNACRRVEPRHIAVAWKTYLPPGASPPLSWKLSPEEVVAARALLPFTPKVITSTSPAVDPATIPGRNVLPSPPTPRTGT
jgi:hypothetical protein